MILRPAGSDDVPGDPRRDGSMRLRALPSGRHRRKPIGDVPADYLLWLVIDVAPGSVDVRPGIIEYGRRI